MSDKPTYDELLQKVRQLEKEASEGQKLEAQAQDRNAFLTLILESLLHPFYVIDVADHSIRLANAAAQKENLVGHTTCYAFAHRRQTPCDSAEHPCPLEIIKKTKKPVTVEHTHYDSEGKLRNVEVHAYPIFDRDGNVSQIIEYTLDITQRKDAEAALRESESKFRSVAQSAKDAIILADTRGKIKFYNAAAQTMFGYAENEIVGRSLTILMPEEFRSSHNRGVKRAAAGRPDIGGKTIETKAVDKEGREFPIELSFSTWQSDSEFFLTGIVRDISKRKQIEAERDQLIKSLQDSLAKLKTLRGLLPICASCKKIRDDKGYWNRIETYIQEHSEAEFSHGICPECARKLYPSFYD